MNAMPNNDDDVSITFDETIIFSSTMIEQKRNKRRERKTKEIIPSSLNDD